MPLINIPDKELSTRAVVTGDAAAASKQGTTTKFRDNDDSNQTDLAAKRTLFNAHTHDGTTGHGVPLGTLKADGTRYDSFEDDAITSAAIGALQVTGAKVVTLDTAALADDSITKALTAGSALTKSKQVANGGSVTINWSELGLGYEPMHHWESWQAHYIASKTTATGITFTAHTDMPADSAEVTVVYRGG